MGRCQLIAFAFLLLCLCFTQYWLCVTAGVSWGDSGWIGGARRFSLPQTGGYNISVKEMLSEMLSASCPDGKGQSV